MQITGKAFFSCYGLPRQLAGGVVVSLSLMAHACSAPQDDDAPGYCRLSCSKTALAASNFTIENIISPADVSCTASNGGAMSRQVKWLIRSPITRVDGSEVVVERPAIEFAVRYGGNGPSGVVTAESEWCSDSCGVATVDILDECPPAGQTASYEYGISIMSAAVVSENVTWSNSPPAE